MKFRHELKHTISYGDMLEMRSRLGAVMEIDIHALEGGYQIRSLYFDNIYDKALREKIDGVDKREKFRLRYYNEDTSRIALEKKSKINGLCNKEQVLLSMDEVLAILNGDTEKLAESDKPLLRELYRKMATEGLKPYTVVDYDRIPFVYGPGNVRVTIDYNIRTGLKATDFLRNDLPTMCVSDNPIILEVKWDEYLPEIVRDAVQLQSAMTSSYSKYAACRMYD